MFISGQSGQSMVAFAAALVVMLGCCALSIDYGFSAFQKGGVQHAADAAALAGAQELPDHPNDAESLARSYAIENGEPGDVIEIDIPDDNRAITVTIHRQVPNNFARVFGSEFTSVRATATAQVGIAASVPWIVPFVIPKPELFEYGQVYVMRIYGGGPYPSGYSYPSDYRHRYSSWPTHKPYPYHFDYMNVKIKAGSNPGVEFNDYLSYLGSGYKETFRINQNMLYFAPSSGGRQSVDTFAQRVNSDSNSDYRKAKIGDPRVMLIPVVEKLMPRNTSENTKVKIIGFVGFFLESVHKNAYGTSFWFEGRFLEDLNIGTGEVTYDAEHDFGLRTIRLTN